MSMTKIWSQTQMKICELHMTAKKTCLPNRQAINIYI
jgi:hypothetical protein